MSTVAMSENTNNEMLVQLELTKMMSYSKDRYLKSLIVQVVQNHPNLGVEIKKILQDTQINRETDQITKLLEDAKFPNYPDHKTLAEFDRSQLSGDNLSLYEEIITLNFLTDSNPNLVFYGIPEQGMETLAIGLGDLICRAGHSVRYIDFYELMNVFNFKTKDAKKNVLYNELMKTNCLIINDFAGPLIYDPDLISELLLLLQARSKAHGEAFVAHKHNPGRKMSPFSTIVTSCFAPIQWTKRLVGDEPVRTLHIINQILGKGQQLTLNIDTAETTTTAQ